MLNKLIPLLLMMLLCSNDSDTFKSEQLRYSRVRQAYKEKETSMLSLLENQQIERGKLQLYIRAFKQEKQIELWGKNSADGTFRLIKTYEVCRTSGTLGPKRKQGDLQIPEGFYHINRFNPYSNFHLSLGINYPNKSDRILADKSDPGGDIFIHGSCVTIGCLPIMDDNIKELYIFCVEARNNGQTKIPVSIFPCKLSDTKFDELQNNYRANQDLIALWTDLKKGYDIFNESKQLPSIKFLSSGRYVVNK